jgi:hypothetical protein
LERTSNQKKVFFIFFFADLPHVIFFRIMSGSVSLHRQLSPEALQQLLAWYKIRDTLLGENKTKQDIKKALELASVCEHPNAVWLTKLFGGRDISSHDEARQVFLGCENDPRALCFAGLLVGTFEEIGRAAGLDDAFAQAGMAWRTGDEECLRWAEKSAAQGERDGFYWLGICYRDGIACEEGVERAKEYFLVAAELGHVYAMIQFGKFFAKDDLQRFFWLGTAAASGKSLHFLNEMSDQIRNFGSGTGYAKVVFVFGRALKGHINTEKRTIFGQGYSSYIGPANHALRFYEFQLQSYRKAVESWTIIGLRNKVVKDIRKMIGKMIWESREEAKYIV